MVSTIVYKPHNKRGSRRATMPSKIEWTDETWNPVTGCTRVSPGCDHCYMFALYPRLKAMGVSGYETDPSEVQLLPERLKIPERWKQPRRVFVNSMSDVFHPHVPFEFINRMFDVMRRESEQRRHIFQVLTKRPGRASAWWERNGNRYDNAWPDGVWIGTSVESQRYAERLTALARLPAKIRFVSVEPLLGPVDIAQWLDRGDIHWVIVGGESGPQARPMDIKWARDLREQAKNSGVAFFLKQLGGRRGKQSGNKAILDGRVWCEFPNQEKGCNDAT